MMKAMDLFVSAVLLILFSCTTAPLGKSSLEKQNQQATPLSNREKDFEQIERLILEMNDIIARKDFDSWKSYLSQSYIDFLSSKKGLSELNSYPQMENHGIILKSMRDYFDWVVVPSRQYAQVVNIVFLNYDEVVAYSMFGGEQVKLYELVRVNSQWRITLWKKYQGSVDTEKPLLL